MISIFDFSAKLKEKGLKVTPQRLAVLEALFKLEGHPTAEMIFSYVTTQYPNMARGTVYHILEQFVDKQFITKVKTEKDCMRYDRILAHHHHLYDSHNEQIRDYFDPEIDHLLHQYFERKGIPDFRIRDIRLHIEGDFQ